MGLLELMPLIQGVDRSALTRPHALLMAGVLLFFYLDAFVLGAPGGMALALLLLAMGLLFALLSFSFAPRLAGIGGDLGATAAVSVFALLGARVLVLDRR